MYTEKEEQAFLKQQQTKDRGPTPNFWTVWDPPPALVSMQRGRILPYQNKQTKNLMPPTLSKGNACTLTFKRFASTCEPRNRLLPLCPLLGTSPVAHTMHASIHTCSRPQQGDCTPRLWRPLPKSSATSRGLCHPQGTPCPSLPRKEPPWTPVPALTHKTLGQKYKMIYLLAHPHPFWISGLTVAFIGVSRATGIRALLSNLWTVPQALFLSQDCYPQGHDGTFFH